MPGPQPRQRRFELQRFVDRFANELLDDRFAPRPKRALAEAAAESLDACDANPVRLVRIAIKHDEPGVGHDLPHLVTLARFDVVVTENSDRRHTDRRQLARQHTRFVRESIIGQVAGNEQDVRGFGDFCKERLKRSLRCLGAMEIGDRGHAQHSGHGRHFYKSEAKLGMLEPGDRSRLSHGCRACDSRSGSIATP